VFIECENALLLPNGTRKLKLDGLIGAPLFLGMKPVIDYHKNQLVIPPKDEVEGNYTEHQGPVDAAAHRD
jgi:hypothetical protein